jgi:hypothetical protein
MASLKAQDHGNAYAEKLAWEGGNRFANSIPPFLVRHTHPENDGFVRHLKRSSNPAKRPQVHDTGPDD